MKKWKVCQLFQLPRSRFRTYYHLSRQKQRVYLHIVGHDLTLFESIKVNLDLKHANGKIRWIMIKFKKQLQGSPGYFLSVFSSMTIHQITSKFTCVSLLVLTNLLFLPLDLQWLIHNLYLYVYQERQDYLNFIIHVFTQIIFVAEKGA